MLPSFQIFPCCLLLPILMSYSYSDMAEEVNVSDSLFTVLETVFLFLKNQNFFNASEAFRNECEQLLGIVLPNISGKVFFRTEERVNVIENVLCSPRKFIDRRIVLETFLQKDDTEINSTGVEYASERNSEIAGKQHLKKQFSQLQEEYKNLLSVTTELTNALNVHIVGQSRNIHSVLDQCKTIYPSLFDPPIDTTDEGNSSSQRNIAKIAIESPQKSNSGSTTSITLDAFEEANASEIVEGGVDTDFDSKNNSASGKHTAHLLPSTDEPFPSKEVAREMEKPQLLLTNSENTKKLNEESIERVMNPCTPVSKHEIKGILDSVLEQVLYIFNETEVMNDSRCCHDKTCRDCAKDISKILEDILFKVMLSPRCEASQYNSNKMSCRSDDKLQELNMVHNKGCFQYNRQTENDHRPNNTPNMNEKIGKDDSFLSSGYSMDVLGSGYSEEIIPVSKSPLINNYPHQENGTMCQKLYQNVENKPEKAAKKHNGFRKIHPDTQFSETTVLPNETGKCLRKPLRLVNFPSPLCYVDVCRKTQDGKLRCKCAKCFPGQSRYYCGCYDLICEEISEEMEPRSTESTCNKMKFFENFHKKDQSEEHVIIGNLQYGKNCSPFCETKICKGAFDSKPKIRRTPPR